MLEQVEREMNRYWSERAQSYSEQNNHQLEDTHAQIWSNLILEPINSNKKLNILDIGTGPGFFAILLAQKGHYVTAIDRNREMLIQARANAKKNKAEVRFIQADDESELEREKFDLVVSRDVTWTMLHPEKMLLQWMDLVIPGGQLQYFDANWHSHLRTEKEKKDYQIFQSEVKRKGGFQYEKAKELDNMALQLPLTFQDRPAWDLNFWEKQGFSSVVVKENLNEKIYNAMEQIQYEKKPEFQVIVKKEGVI